MELWVVLLAVMSCLVQCQNVDSEGDYELKRFHVQSRQLNGSPQCYLSRRKRSAKSLDDQEAEYLGAPVTFDEEDGVEENEDIEEMEDDDEIEDNGDSIDDNQNPSGLLITDSDLKGEGGILVIQNGGPSSQPLLFQIRPTDTDATDSDLRTYDENDPDAEKEDYATENDSLGIYANNNRFRPNSALKPFTDSDSSEYMDIDPPKVQSQKEPPKRKRKPTRPINRPSATTTKPSRKRKPSKDQNKTKKKSKKKRKTNNKHQTDINYLNVNQNHHRNDFRDSVNNNAHKNKRLSVNFNKGSGTKTLTRTVTTTQTGTAAGDNPDVNCIIINKPSTATTERPFLGLLGRNVDDNGADRSFGLRKRIRQFAG